MSDMRHIANALSQYGRQGDTELVHMSKNEVQALGLMSPRGQLTRNPDTGLHEAFSLEDIIGPIAGIAAAIFAPELLPWIAGANGVAVAADTGDLGKGLMAGLTTYGLGAGAGAIGGSLGLGAGAQASAASMGGDVASGLTAGEAGGASTLGTDVASGLSNTAGFGGSVTAGASPALAAAQTADAAGSGTLGNVGGWIADHPMMTAGGIMALGALSPNGTNYPDAAVNQPKGPGTPLVQGPVPRNASMPAGYVPGYSPEGSFFSPQAGAAMQSPATVQAAQQLNAFQAPSQSLLNASLGGGGLGSDAQRALQAMQQRQMRGYADGGIVDYPGSMGGGYAPGGPVMGPGDGTSDSVPAMINGQAPVQLATDEHIVPADVVSGIGNGSSNAGHKALQAMSARVRGARSNGRKMPRTIRPGKFMPA